jgi:penicillin-binding protein 1A
MSPRARRLQRRPKRSAGKKALLGLGVVALMASIGVAAAVAWAISVYDSAPSIDSLPKINRGASSAIYAADGTRLAYIHADRVRQPLSEKQIPDLLKQATVDIEDRNFYSHGGVDPSAIIRAGFKDLLAGSAVQGGSTITQQLVRNLYRTDPHDNIQRKLKEAHWANELESEHSKDWILRQYLNTAPYGTNNGSTAIGVQAAAETYFSKAARELTLPQAALIAGLPQAPTDYNPFLSPKAAKARRNEVLRAMLGQNDITPAQYRNAFHSGLGLTPGDRYSSVKEPLIVNLIEQELIDKYGLRTVRYGGLKVYTTIQPTLQDEAQRAVDSDCSVCSYDSSAAAALASVDPKTGAIVALASSSSYSDQNQFNLAAQGQKQPGSSFKTYVLTTAVKQGIDPDSTYYDGTAPKDLSSVCACGTWIVNNSADGEGSSAMSLRDATVQSINVVFAQLGLDVGPSNFAQTAYSMGITSPLGITADGTPCKSGDGCFIPPADAIGGLTVGVTPLEQADAYATLANGGVHHDATAIAKVVFPDGHTDAVGSDSGNRVLSPGVAYDVTNVLKGVITGGTGAGYTYMGCPDEAGKTGTAEDESDAWFVGYTPAFSTAVWVGHPTSRATTGFGGPTAGPIWRAYMEAAQGSNCPSFNVPSTLPSLSPFFSDLTASAPHSGGSSTSGGASVSTTGSTSTTDTTGGGTGACDPAVYNCGGGGFQTPPSTPTPPDTGGGPPSGTPPSQGGGGGTGGGIGPG